VDAVGIANRLSIDKDARSKLVQLAMASVDTTANGNTKQAMLDSMSAKLENEIQRMQNIVALGWGDYGKQKDSAEVLTKYYAKKREQHKGADYTLIMKDTSRNRVILDSIYQAKPKWFRTKYAIRESFQTKKLLGLLVTAFAICLGAPFWFDLLSKVVKLRSAGVKEGEKIPPGKSGVQQMPVTVITPPTSREEAVG
jgi:hypothetical protein